ncbi:MULTISPECIES: hypothetical protein [Chryseobacterium]|nr:MULTISPECIES: hypothetical protein [Chryseobacterium]
MKARLKKLHLLFFIVSLTGAKLKKDMLQKLSQVRTNLFPELT